MPTASSRRAPVLFFVLTALAAWPSVGHAQLGKLGVLGDSLSDEYLEETYSYAKNWTVQLEQFRGVNLGRTATEAGQPGNTWGEPRRRWFETNWARSGADSASLLSQGQHTGVASQAGAGLTHAVLAIGANDFSPLGIGAYFNIYNGFWSQAQITNYVNGRIANVTAAANTVRGAGVKLVLCNFVDYGVAPSVWMSAFYNNATKRERVSAVIRRVNDGLESYARQNGLPYVDLNGLGVAIFGPNGTPEQFLVLGGRNVELWVNDTASHTRPLAGFVDDGVHPHTTLQGCFANVMIAALNLGYGAGITPLSESEILAIAGVSYGGSDTLEAQIGRYEDYVTNFACLADYTKDGFVSGDDFDAYVFDFETGAPRADFDGDGFITGDDFDAFLAAFEIGCG